MKVSSRSIYTAQRTIPSVKFESDSHMTSFGGLVIFQQLFVRLGLWNKLGQCAQHLAGHNQYSHPLCLRIILVHLLLGFNRLRDLNYYQSDPMVLRVLGIARMPSVPTVSRLLSSFDTKAVDNFRSCSRDIVLNRLEALRPASLTLDFDGSVLSTKRHAEGAAVGFNKEKKGARSYYPLFCTIAQTGQVFDVLHRSGNVHDSNGALDFIEACVRAVRQRLPKVRLEARMDAAFFSDEIIRRLGALGVQYSISVPFERFVELKGIIESCKNWQPVAGREESAHFEMRWKPQCWKRRERFIFVRDFERKQRKGPIQLDLFEPIEREYKYKVIITNKQLSSGRAVAFHEGRGYQEKIFSELKSDAGLGYIPCRRRAANEVWMLGAVMAHNLGREIQFASKPDSKPATMKRTAQWMFESLGTLRRNVIQRAARLTRPQGKLTLILPNIPALRSAIERFSFGF